MSLPRLVSCSSILIWLLLGSPATGAELIETFDGTLEQWDLYGSPLPYIDASIGDPAPSIQINGDSNYDSGLNSRQTFRIGGAPLSITASFRPSGPFGHDFQDAYMAYGTGGEYERYFGAWLKHNWNEDGTFLFIFSSSPEGGEVARYRTEYAVTERRWIECEIKIREDLFVEYIVDGTLLWVSPEALDPTIFDDRGVVIGGRQYLIDNVAVNGSDPFVATTWGKLKQRF